MALLAGCCLIASLCGQDVPMWAAEFAGWADSLRVAFLTPY